MGSPGDRMGVSASAIAPPNWHATTGLRCLISWTSSARKNAGTTASSPNTWESLSSPPNSTPVAVPSTHAGYCGSVAPSIASRSKPACPRVASAQEVSTMVCASIERLSLLPRSAGAATTLIGRNLALGITPAATAAAAPPSAARTAVAASCDDPAYWSTDIRIGATKPRHRRKRTTRKPRERTTTRHGPRPRTFRSSVYRLVPSECGTSRIGVETVAGHRTSRHGSPSRPSQGSTIPLRCWHTCPHSPVSSECRAGGGSACTRRIQSVNRFCQPTRRVLVHGREAAHTSNPAGARVTQQAGPADGVA
jgi:hypothetical protein